MLLWFLTLLVLGVRGILRQPAVLSAVNPAHAVLFFQHNGGRGFFVLGAVFLVATGAEGVYADPGPCGKRPMRVDWFFVVAPAPLPNPFGQGRLVLSDP